MTYSVDEKLSQEEVADQIAHDVVTPPDDQEDAQCVYRQLVKARIAALAALRNGCTPVEAVEAARASLPWRA